MRLLRWNVVFFFAMLAGTAFAQNASFQSIFRTPTFHTLRKIGYASADTMYAIGDGASFVRTTDGATLQRFSVEPNNNESLYYINFMSSSVGVVAGDNGLMAITSDGGSSWLTLLHSKERITAAGFDPTTFINPLGITGFAATASGNIYTTTNSGSTWSTFNARVNHPNATFVQACALGNKTFLAVLANNFIFKTTNDGVTWDSLTGIALSGITDMCFSDPSNGWIVNTDFWETTTDGGNDWNFGGVWGGTPVSPVAENIVSVYFKDNTHGWALGSKPSGPSIYAPLFATADGGTTFGLLPTHADSTSGIGDGNAYLKAIRFDATGTYGWAVGDAGTVERSTDGGKTWKYLATGVAEQATPSVSFFDDTAGVVCGQNGRGSNYSTTNSGVTWRAYPTGENAHTVAMMLTSQNAITFGNLAASSANAFRTTNGGTSWSSVTVPPGNYTRIYDIDANTVMACGQSGLVAISTNGGAQWSNATITPDQPNLGGIYFSDKNHGFACGGAGALYATSNGGSTWTQNTNISTAADLNDIAFNSASSGWAVSDSDGVVFHSNDGGNNWAPMSISASAHDTLTRVVFADANNGWIAGSYGQLYQTTNGGTTWVSINTGTSNKISDLSYTPRTNPTTIWLAGGEGMIMKSPPNPVGVKEINITPHGFALGQNYPNPFSVAGSSTSIPFSVTAEATVRLDVYNVLGECVRTLVNESKAPGSYIVSWDGHNTSGETVPNGVYFFRLGNGTNQLVRSAIVTK